ncbi:Dehydrogenase/reductase SDR member 12, partial [Blyttiomyces sp. JEL0837]
DAIVTGANNGLGRSVALELAKRGATVHMLCRSQLKGQQARDEIASESKNDNIILHVVDVSRPKEIKNFVERFNSNGRIRKVDILINNAAILPWERTETPDGIESCFATNTLGSWYLTELLVKSLELVDDARVINVSSSAMFYKKLDVTDLQFKNGFNGMMAYAQTKRQQVELNEYWAIKYPNIRFYSMHP